MPLPQTSPWDTLAMQYDPMLAQDRIFLAQNQLGLPPEAELELAPPPMPAPLPQTGSSVKMKETFTDGGGVGPMSRSNYEESVRRLNEKGIQSLALQSQGIRNLEGMREALNSMPRQTDLSPVSNLLDQWTGQDLTSAYKRPLSPEERTQLMMQLEGQIQKSREGLSGNEIDLLRSQLGMAAQREASIAREEDRKLSRDALNASKALANQDRKDRHTQQSREKFVGTDDAKQMAGITKFTQALDRYEDMVNKHGINPTGVASRELSSAYSKLQTAYKEAEKLGALAGPDLGILYGAVGESADLKSYITSKYKGDKEGILAGIKEIRDGGRRDFTDAYNRSKVVFPDLAADVLPEYQRQYDERPTLKKKTLTAGSFTPGQRIKHKTSGQMYLVNDQGVPEPIK